MSCFCSPDWLFLRQSAHMVSSSRSWVVSLQASCSAGKAPVFPGLQQKVPPPVGLPVGACSALVLFINFSITYSLWMITMTERNKQPPDGDSNVKQDKHSSFQVVQKLRQGPVVVACLCFMMSASSAGRLEAWSLQSFEDLAELENHSSLLASWLWFLPNWASCQGC